MDHAPATASPVVHIAPAAWWADAITIVSVVAAFAALTLIGKQFTAPLVEPTVIDRSIGALPWYTLLSLGRGFAAYALSLLFTLSYGSIAAHHPRAERIMMPVLDVLQAIPVLGFLPGLLLAMVALFPTRELGLEIASILMVFTGQVWNMTFSFHASLRAIPPALREVAAVEGFSTWQTFRLLELPAAMIGLVWNSMMSMAGGWFFLTVTEAFTLRNRDYRLPGIGAYMNEAIQHKDTVAMLAAITAMVIMIVLVDQIVWRPLVVWSQRFKLEEVSSADTSRSWFLDVLERSHLLRSAQHAWQTWQRYRITRLASRPARTSSNVWLAARQGVGRVAQVLALAAVCGLGTWGLVALVRLLTPFPLYDPGADADWRLVVLALAASFLRTTTAVLLGAAWTVPVGILIGLSPRWSRRLQPLIQVVASFPAPMLFPLMTILLHGLGVPFTIGCVLLMMLGTQWYLLFNTIAGASSIPEDLKEVARVFRLRPHQRWWRLYLPAVFPHVTTGLITAAGGAWNATIVSEYVLAAGDVHIAFGLGSLINHATASGNFPLLTAGVVTMAASVVAINRLVWKRLYRVSEERFGLTS